MGCGQVAEVEVTEEGHCSSVLGEGEKRAETQMARGLATPAKEETSSKQVS